MRASYISYPNTKVKLSREVDKKKKKIIHNTIYVSKSQGHGSRFFIYKKKEKKIRWIVITAHAWMHLGQVDKYTCIWLFSKCTNVDVRTHTPKDKTQPKDILNKQ